MTDQQWRAITPAEIAVVEAILSGSGLADGARLAVNINRAQVSVETGWILDIVNPDNDVRIDIPDGPFPVRAFVPDSVNYRGEVIIWITDGRISGLEYAWITDEPPTRRPHPDELQIVNQCP
ncbi:hypothetical protein ACPCIR_02140 [Mycobacterium sp. NPDC051198]